MVDFENVGGLIDLVRISGLLRLRLIALALEVLSTPAVVLGLRASSTGDSRNEMGGCCWAALCAGSSVGIMHGSTVACGRVWLRGLLELLSVEGMRDWLPGVKGLSETKVEDGLVKLVEKEGEVSMEIVLLELS